MSVRPALVKLNYYKEVKTIGPRRSVHSRRRPRRSSKGVKIPIQRKGALIKHGYSTDKSDVARHRALSKAADEYGAKDVWHMLQAQIMFRKRKQPKQRSIFEEDREWLEQTFNPDLTPYAAIEAWEAMSENERARRMPGG